MCGPRTASQRWGGGRGAGYVSWRVFRGACLVECSTCTSHVSLYVVAANLHAVGRLHAIKTHTIQHFPCRCCGCQLKSGVLRWWHSVVWLSSLMEGKRARFRTEGACMQAQGAGCKGLLGLKWSPAIFVCGCVWTTAFGLVCLIGVAVCIVCAGDDAGCRG